MAAPKRTAPRSDTGTMRAAVQTHYGTSAHDVVEIGDLPRPQITSDQVLIQVAASSLNALDTHFMTGTPYLVRLDLGLTRPKKQVRGGDVAGTIVEVGSGVTGFSVGDEVFGEIESGGFAEYAVADLRVLARAPSNLPLEESATLGVAALTALQGLRDWAQLSDGDRVLINGASGGVGTFAVQIAKALGASHVTAVCSTHNVETARALGADRVIDYTVEDFTEIEATFDVVFDNAGSKSLSATRRMLNRDGVLVMITGRKGRWIRPVDRMLAGMIRSRFWSQRFVSKTARPSGADGAVLARMVDDSLIRPAMDRRFGLDEAADALAYQTAGHARGKSLVVVS